MRGGSAWKALVNRRQEQRGRKLPLDDLDDARRILDACKDDIAELWTNDEVQAVLREEGLCLEEQAGLCVVLN